jgi:hypothetical protein
MHFKAMRYSLAVTALFGAAVLAYTPAGQFRTEEQAKKYCPNDVVVRVNLSTRLFYTKGHFLYQSAGVPTFECRREALQEGNLPG